MRLIDKLQVKAERVGASFDMESFHKNTYNYTCPHGVVWRTRLSKSENLPSTHCSTCKEVAQTRRKRKAYEATQTAAYREKCRRAQLERYSDESNRKAHSDAMLKSEKFAKAVRSQSRRDKLSASLRASSRLAEATWNNPEWVRNQAATNQRSILEKASSDHTHPAHYTSASVVLLDLGSGIYKIGKARDVLQRYGRLVKVLAEVRTTEYRALCLERDLLADLRKRGCLTVNKDAVEHLLRRGHGWTECFTDSSQIQELITKMETADGVDYSDPSRVTDRR